MVFSYSDYWAIVVWLISFQGCYTVCICLGPIIGGISGGYIAGNLGLAWIHWINVLLSGTTFISCAILVPETLFIRTHMAFSTNEHSTKNEAKPSVQIVENMVPSSSSNNLGRHANCASMWKLNIYEGNIMEKLAAPWKTLCLPGVWLVMFWYAGLVGGVVTITTVGPSIVAAPPYLWGNNSGLIMSGGIVGAILGLIITNLHADQVILNSKISRGNSLVEPERRLPVAIPGLILATTGLWTFGFCAQNSGPPHMWIGMQFGLGMLSFGLMQAPSVGFNYVSNASARFPQTGNLFLINLTAY